MKMFPKEFSFAVYSTQYELNAFLTLFCIFFSTDITVSLGNALPYIGARCLECFLLFYKM